MVVVSCIVLLLLIDSYVYARDDGFEKVQAPDPSLKYVVGIYRHGTRAPLYFNYKTDPYKPDSKYYPEGKGHLTKAGKLLMFDVGRFLRARYDRFIDDRGVYDPRKTQFTSASGSRNLLSACLVTEGMFSPGAPDLANINKHNIPIPSNTSFFDKSYLVSDFPKRALDCNYFSVQFAYNIINSLILPKTKENIELLSYLSEKTGIRFESVVSFLNIWDRLECERLNGLKLPQWSESVYPEKMKPLALAHVHDTIAGTPLMNDLGSGLFFKEIHRRFNDLKAGQIKEKIYLHATHENGIYQVLFKLKFKSPEKVEVGDTMLFEVHDIKGKIFVKIYYYVPFEKTLMLLTLPGCAETCPLDTFIRLTPEMSQDRWQQLCHTKATSQLSKVQSIKNLRRFFRELYHWIV